MRRPLLALLLASAAAAFSGCAADTDTDHNDSEEVGQSEDALALASLYGTWTDQGGVFATLTFTKEAASTAGMKGRRFAATLEGSAQVSGVYKLTHGTQLWLTGYGEYGVRLKAKKLTLTKRSDRSIVQTFDKAVVHSAAEILAAAEAHVWPVRDPGSVYRTFDTRAAAEAWGNTQSDGNWLARDGQTAVGTKFVSGSNDLWSQELVVDKITLAVTVTGEH